MKKIRILYIAPTKLEDGFSWLAGFFDSNRFQFSFYGLDQEKSAKRVLAGLFIKTDLCKYDIVITTEYYTTFAISLKLKLMGNKAKNIKQIAYGFNRSRRKLGIGIGFMDKIINSVFQRSDMFLTFSRFEQSLFAKEHDLNPDKFFSTLWSYDLPQFEPGEFSKPTRPYVCFIGRNNRDFEGFARAIDGLDVDGVIIAPSYLSESLDNLKSEHILVYYDRDLNTCIDCIKNSLASVILVNNADVGAGHITMVIAMLLGKTQIISDVPTISDYFVGGVHGITVPLNDTDAVRKAILRLESDADLRAKYEQASKDYALKWFSPKREAFLLEKNIAKLMSNQEFDRYDADWASEYSKLIEKQ